MLAPSYARRAWSLTTLGAGLLVVIGLNCSAFAGRPLFVVKPNPPKAGEDVHVVYGGNNDDDVVFEIGDGESHSAKIGKDKTFTIPKGLLKAGKKLRILDLLRAPRGDASVCFYIEPKS